MFNLMEVIRNIISRYHERLFFVYKYSKGICIVLL